MQNADPNSPVPVSSQPRFQVAVAGAGPAGSALALVLAGAGLSVLLLEQSAFGAARVGELLSPDAVHVLCQMAPSLGKRLLGLALSVVSAWSGRELERIDDGSELPWRAVDRLELDRSLAQEAAAHGARLITSARLSHPTWFDEGYWKLEVEHEGQTESFECDYLVDATGRASLLSRQFGAVRLRQSGQVAVVGFLEIPESLEVPPEMLLETTNDGWWYSAPLSERDAVAVFITDDDLDKGPPEEAWRRALQASRHTRERFSPCSLKERPRRVAANSSLLLPSYGQGWMAVGDAASCFDPLSIHGLGRALLQGAKVGEFLAESFSRGEEPNPTRLAEDNGEEFLKETMTLSVNYRRVKQWPNSIFWQRRGQAYPSGEVSRQKRRPRSPLLESYAGWVSTLLEERPSPGLPRKVAVSWGRGIEWEQYLEFEANLLSSSDLEATLRESRWKLSLWACDPSLAEFNLADLSEPMPESFLVWLENLLVGALLCCLEHDPGQNSSDLFRLLVDDRPVSFPRIGWAGRFSELAKARQLQDIEWIRTKSACYQRELLQRKFLAMRAPLLHNLCLLSVLPNFFLTYSLLFSMHRGADRIEREDYFRTLELAEMEIVTYGRLDQLSHTIVGFHLDRALEARKARLGLET